jgi:hypothetical protein
MNIKQIILTEILEGTPYDIKLDEKNTGWPLPTSTDGGKTWKKLKSGLTSYRYSFVTKDDIKYRVMLSISNNNIAQINFDTLGLKDKKHSSMIELIGTGDAIKVFNTIKVIIYKHKDEFKQLTLKSTPERTTFYKKMLDYLNISNTYDPTESMIIATL